MRLENCFYRKIYTKCWWGLEALPPCEWKAQRPVALKSRVKIKNISSLSLQPDSDWVWETMEKELV